MTRIYNFSAGPAVLPEEVLQQAAEEMIDWRGTGMSVMEMSHRGDAFVSIAEQAEADLRELLGIPDHYRVLFLQGGATGQFAGVPQNLLRGARRADYVNTGAWSSKAIAEAKKFCEVHVAADNSDTRGMSIPEPAGWDLSESAAYVHYTPNETISGLEFHWVPETGAVPKVADMSSTLLSRPIDVEQFGLIYAGAQKNIGPSGLTLVIVRDDLTGDTLPGTPAIWDYKAQADADSALNTPPTYALYVAGLVFQWLKRQGGLEGIAAVNRRKADRLYRFVDDSPFYANPVDPACRSWMNVPFTLADDGLDGTFLEEAEAVGLSTLKGHRSVGGMRASIYNAMPEAGVERLVEFMADFERRYG